MSEIRILDTMAIMVVLFVCILGGAEGRDKEALKPSGSRVGSFEAFFDGNSSVLGR